ncbi:hypothetical protein DY000_02015320 [Brassica cretica]|uniref:Tyrosinase copper-binding domain-containing protein n=1 Tax=Brassica cretica TaxID=69181 RepID=A0ABQ7D0D4_BRACR|nr:hypothetical protein DY000_02015320 [Brassica cretica]
MSPYWRKIQLRQAGLNGWDRFSLNQGTGWILVWIRLSYHASPSAAPAPDPPGPPGVMSVAELVRQPSRDHLPYLTPFNRSGNGIRAWINHMMYSALDKGHPTFTDFPTDKQHLWFRQFAQEFNWNSDDTFFIYHHFVHKVMDNYGKQIHEWKKK